MNILRLKKKKKKSISSTMPSPSSVSFCIDSISSSAIPAAAASVAHNPFDPPSRIAVRNQGGQMICTF
jgi:hypothetical protein